MEFPIDSPEFSTAAEAEAAATATASVAASAAAAAPSGGNSPSAIIVCETNRISSHQGTMVLLEAIQFNLLRLSLALPTALARTTNLIPVPS
mmetsp:Transcript_29391/g.65190  ORF Transcript_29391/g.65190 Transcript_29391/m.65190 type:complete len:92 (+) Transcript_29391:1191-1466(+)